MDPGWIVAVIAAATTAAGLGAWLMKWAWNTITRTGRFLDDYFGEPAREGMAARPGVMGRLQSLEDKLSAVLSETRPNGGGSFRDELRRVGTDVGDVKNALQGLTGRVDGLASRVELFEKQREARDSNA